MDKARIGDKPVVEREKGYGYYVDKDGYLWKVKFMRKGRPLKFRPEPRVPYDEYMKRKREDKENQK